VKRQDWIKKKMVAPVGHLWYPGYLIKELKMEIFMAWFIAIVGPILAMVFTWRFLTACEDISAIRKVLEPGDE